MKELLKLERPGIERDDDRTEAHEHGTDGR